MKFHSTVIFVRDIEISKEFYSRYLGFSIEHDFGKNVILNNGLTLWEINEGHIINSSLSTKNESNRFELYFESEELETVFNQVDSGGITFLHTIHEEPWGQRTFRFLDPDNHLIEIGETMEMFVNNMKNRGMSPEQISKKSGIPVETIKILLRE